MAANTQNNRIKIKWIRDGAKAKYPPKISCAICDTTENLELHHYTSLTNLLDRWQKETGIPLNTDEEVLAIRDRFISEHNYELYTAVACLCAEHHKALHKVYGKSPLLSTAAKQEQWVLKKRESYTHEPKTVKPDIVVPKSEPRPRNDVKTGGVFSKLISSPNSFSSFRTS